MATIERRPVQYKLGNTENTATISDSSGDALVNKSSHGLSDGDVVYLITEAESYNGFKFVDVISSSTFKIRNTENGANITFYKTTDATYFDTVLEHGWQSVHQPIVYQISNDKYPTNESYVQATITSVSDENGYVKITCSGNIDSSLVDLDFVKISNFGVYQIKDAVSNSIAVLDLAYDSTFDDMDGETVQFYYNNFHIVVNVYGGLNSSHPYAFVKPYELLATLRLIPDENNLVTFDISDILKANVTGKNNLLLDTLPLNLEAFTQFYISYDEEYDVSDGSEISLFVDDTVVDSFEGYAIDAVMPFKSRNISALSEYVASDSIPGAFLTLFNRPVFITGYYYDLSFIKNNEGNYYADINGSLIYFEDKGPGVYRLPITESMLYSDDELCVSVHTEETIIPPAAEPTVAAFGDGTQIGSGTSWAHGVGTWDVVIPPSGSTKYLLFEITGGVAEVEYTIGYEFDITSLAVMQIVLMDETQTQVLVESIFMNPSGNFTGSRVFDPAPTFIPKYLGFRHGTSLSGTTISISPFTFDVDMGDTVIIPGVQLTDEICIDILDAPCVIDIGTEDFISGSGSGGCDCPDGILLE